MPNDNAIEGVSSALQTIIQGSMSLEGTAKGHVRKTSTSATFQTVFEAGGSGFIHTQLVTTALSGATAEMRVFDEAVLDANKIGHAKAGANDSKIATGSPAHFINGTIVQLKSDGTNEVEGLISIVGAEATANFIIISGKAGYMDDRFVDSNFGAGTGMTTSNVFGEKAQSLVEFDLSSVPFGTVLSSAVLRLTTVNNHGGGQTLDLWKVLKEWIELEFTWNDRKTSTAWGTPGLGAGDDKSATPDVSFVMPALVADESFDIDITSIVQDWVDGTTINNGIVLEFQTTNSASNLTLYSDDEATSAFKPTLTIVPA